MYVISISSVVKKVDCFYNEWLTVSTMEYYISRKTTDLSFLHESKLTKTSYCLVLLVLKCLTSPQNKYIVLSHYKTGKNNLLFIGQHIWKYVHELKL